MSHAGKTNKGSAISHKPEGVREEKWREEETIAPPTNGREYTMYQTKFEEPETAAKPTGGPRTRMETDDIGGNIYHSNETSAFGKSFS